MTTDDGQFVAAAALDAIAVTQERITAPHQLLGIQITLIVRTPTGIRIVNTLKERAAA
jgi:hypothetical protein